MIADDSAPAPLLYCHREMPTRLLQAMPPPKHHARHTAAMMPCRLHRPLSSKACEMFILELTLRGWLHAEDGRRRTLQRCDIATALASTEVFDFLVR